jgi:hypothetical protein
MLYFGTLSVSIFSKDDLFDVFINGKTSFLLFFDTLKFISEYIQV